MSFADFCSRFSQELESVKFSDSVSQTLLFADDMILLVEQWSLAHTVMVCRESACLSSRFLAMVVSWERVSTPGQGEFLRQVEK